MGNVLDAAARVFQSSGPLAGIVSGSTVEPVNNQSFTEAIGAEATTVIATVVEDVTHPVESAERIYNDLEGNKKYNHSLVADITQTMGEALGKVTNLPPAAESWRREFLQKANILDQLLGDTPPTGVESWLRMLKQKNPALVNTAVSILGGKWIVSQQDEIFLGKESEALKHYQTFLDEVYFINSEGQAPPSGDELPGSTLDRDLPSIGNFVDDVKKIVDVVKDEANDFLNGSWLFYVAVIAGVILIFQYSNKKKNE